jgi:hypothetical protein
MCKDNIKTDLRELVDRTELSRNTIQMLVFLNAVVNNPGSIKTGYFR